MDNLFEKYWLEYDKYEVIKNEQGFILFKCYDNQTCYIRSIYVLPEHRKSKLGSKMADDVFNLCRIRGIKKVFGSVDVALKEAGPLMSFLKYGFELSHCDGQVLWIVKEV